jgi:tellurite resistance protein TerC
MVDGTIGTPGLWAGFVAFVLLMLALDLGVFHRKAHVVSLKEAGIWSGIWVLLSAAFAAILYLQAGEEQALEFTTGYLIEKTLAVDNIFVFVLVFAAFRVPDEQQHRVLVWGVLGALFMRAAFIMAGSAFLHRFEWAVYVFGGLLAVTGVKLLLQKDGEGRPENGRIVRFLRRYLPISESAHGGKFFAREGGRMVATPLFLTLATIEVSDLVFAIDSVPAIFAVTRDPVLVFTSNIFAILGLRAMYFLLAGVVGKFRYLKVGLSGVLVFVGLKMLLANVVEVPILLSLAAIALIIGVAAVASVVAARRERGSMIA